MKIKVEKRLCSGCRICEAVCSLSHTGRINPERSAIRVYKDDLGNGMMEPRLCRQCREMKCLGGGDAEEQKERKKFLWDRKRAEHCPFGALQVFEDQAYHCDLCAGKPKCVSVCTTGALRIQRTRAKSQEPKLRG